jgi:AcrR family transcriptional regulator
MEAAMSPKVPRAYLEARRSEILEAAIKCFVAKGFHNTTMQDIYEATNLSPGAVYNYFSSKEEIVAATVEEFSRLSIQGMDSLESEHPDDYLAAYIDFWLEFVAQTELRESFSVQLAFYAEAMRSSTIRESMLKSQAATHHKLEKYIRQKQEAGLFNPELTPESIARTIMGMVFGMAIHRFIEPGVDLEAYGQVLHAFIQGTLCGQPS